MDLSVIIVSYNTKKLTSDAINSLCGQDQGVSFETIVIDNNSQDGSVEALRNFVKEYKNFKLIENSSNTGFAFANNQGIKIADGKYILLLNSDTVVKKGALKKLLNFARSKSDAGVIAPRLLNGDGTIQPSCLRFPTIKNAIFEYWFGKKGLFEKYAPKEKNPVSVDSVVGAAFLITPKARKKVGSLDEKYFFYFEDIDYCRRVKRAGLKVYYLPEAEIIHYHGASGKKIADIKNQWRRLIPSSKIYHGVFKHYLLFLITWFGQKFSKFRFLAILILLTIPTIWKLMQPGFFYMQDDLQAFRVYEMDKCFNDFQIPCRWVPDAGYQYGYPQFNYYPPLPYYLGAILHRLGFQYIDSVKILFILGYVFSAVAIYVLVESLIGPWAALVTGALYTYIPYKAVEVYVRGALNEFWALIFFPLIFWSIYKLARSAAPAGGQGKIKYLIWLAFSIGALITTHSLMTMIFVPFALVWGLYWLMREKWKNTLKIIWGGVLGFGLSAFFILPVIFERKFAHVESLLSGYFDYRQHFVSLYKLFVSMEWGYGSSGFPNEKLNLSLGIVAWIVGLVIAPIAAIIRFRKDKKISIITLVLSALALLSIFMMHLKSSFIWAKLPFMWYLQFPWRFLGISIFLLSILGGLVVYLSGKLKYVFGIILIAVSIYLYLPFFTPKSWLNITDSEKFSGQSWEKQLTISIFDYLPIYATLPPWSKAPEFPEVLEGKANFSEYKKGSNYQKGVVEVEEDSLIRLPLFDFPGMQVWVDGQKVTHRHDDCRGERYCLGLITFNVPAGRHEIFAKLYDTPIRKVGNVLTLLSLGAVGILMIKSKRNLSK